MMTVSDSNYCTDVQEIYQRVQYGIVLADRRPIGFIIELSHVILAQLATIYVCKQR